MFEFLRRGATSLFAKLFLAIIVIVFIFWGIGTFTGDREQLIAEMGKEKITAKEFREYYNYQLFQFKLALGEQSLELTKDPKFKEAILQDLLRKKHLFRQAERMGLTVSKMEVEAYLAQIPAFQEKGVFSQAKYQAFLREIGVRANFFEELLKGDLLEQKVSSLFNAVQIISQEEAEDFAKFFFQTLQFKVAKLSLEACFSEVKPTESELESFFHTRRDLYTEEEKVKLAYLFLPYKGEVPVTDEEVKGYYEKNLSKFKAPYRVKLRSISIKGATQESFAKAQDIKAKLKELKDFSNFGVKTSEWFEETHLPEALRSLIRMAKLGDILGPVKVNDGYLIVGIEEVSSERLRKLEEVRPQILKILKEEKLKASTLARANELFAKVVKEDGLLNLSKKDGLRLEETVYLTKAQLLALLQDLQAVDRIFKEKKGAYLAPISTANGVFLVEIIDRKEQRNLDLSEAKERVRADYLKEKGKILCEDKAKALIASVKKGEDFVQVAKAKGFSVFETKLRRVDLDPEARLQKGLSIGVMDEPSFTEKDIRVLYLERIESPSKFTPEDLTLAKETLISLKKAQVQRLFLKEPEEKTKLKIYPLFHQI